MSTVQLECSTVGNDPALRSSPTRFYHSLAFWTVVAVAVGVAWRTLRFFMRFPVWGDESFVCVNLLDNTFAGLFGPLRWGQLCPMPFLWSELAMVRLFGPSELVLRMLPYLAGLAALALFWLLCRQVLARLPASLAMALLAVSYYPVRHAVEVKPYSEDLLVALSLLLSAVYYVLNPCNLRWLVFLALFVPLAVVSSYPAVMIAGALSPVLLPIIWKQPGRAAKGWFLVYNLLLLTTFVSNYLLVGKPQLSPHEGNASGALNSTFGEWFPAPEPASFLLWFLKAHTGNMLAYPIGGPDFASSLSTILCLVGVWSWWRDGNRHILALMAGPFLLSMAAAIVHKYPYGASARLDQHLAPAICLFMGNGISFLIHRFASTAPAVRKSALTVVILLAAFGTVGLIRDLVKPYKTTAELWNRDFVDDLIARLGPQDRVVIFHPPQGVRPGLEWYFRQHDDRVLWNGALEQTSGKIWCVQIDRPATDSIPALVARSGISLVQVDYYQSLAPPEHTDDPELAEVFCFAPH